MPGNRPIFSSARPLVWGLNSCFQKLGWNQVYSCSGCPKCTTDFKFLYNTLFLRAEWSDGGLFPCLLSCQCRPPLHALPQLGSVSTLLQLSQHLSSMLTGHKTLASLVVAKQRSILHCAYETSVFDRHCLFVSLKYNLLADTAPLHHWFCTQNIFLPFQKGLFFSLTTPAVGFLQCPKGASVCYPSFHRIRL